MSERKKDIGVHSRRVTRRKEWREDSEDILPDWEEAKKIYNGIRIPEELDSRIRNEIIKRKK